MRWLETCTVIGFQVHDGGEVSVNLADGDYDEAANAREFQDAVAAWRGGGVPSGESSAKSSTGAEFGFGPETAEPADPSSSLWTNPFASTPASSSVAPPRAFPPTSSSGSVVGRPSLADGDYDEAANALEFQDAVAAWRGGGSASGRGGISGGGNQTSARAGAMSSSTSVGRGGSAFGSRAEAAAAALAKQLDDSASAAKDGLIERRLG
jgi:hypothetical protein